MLPNHSPWIHQLKRTRPVTPLDRNMTTDVVVVGGGIAGMVTAFFTLKYTNKKVAIIEADKVAHGATGHNAGQITSYFERPLFDIVAEFGLEEAVAGQKAVESAWGLIDEISADINLSTPLYRFTGYAGCATLESLVVTLESNLCRVNGGLIPEAILVAQEFAQLKEIPAKYKDLYSVVPQSNILSLLESDNLDYIVSFAFQKGCMNSALFTEELLSYLVRQYPQRFALFEESPVTTVALRKHDATVEVKVPGALFTVDAERVVLCTNGFTHFNIRNDGGPDIDTEFHHLLHGRIGYMAGYVEPLDTPPTAISYIPKEAASGDPTGDSYVYLTRRPHEHESKKPHNLLCAGGPERVLPNQAIYSRKHELSEEFRETIDTFLRQNYRNYPTEPTEYAFSWHGLMGYTPNGIRRIGVEPCNPVLLYNLGCNGVGILPAIYGGKRISQLLGGEKLPPSIFDLHDQR